MSPRLQALASGKAWVRTVAARWVDPDQDCITPVAGHGDYRPVVRQLVADRFQVTMLYWAHASREPQQAASHCHTLDPLIVELALG